MGCLPTFALVDDILARVEADELHGLDDDVQVLVGEVLEEEVAGHGALDLRHLVARLVVHGRLPVGAYRDGGGHHRRPPARLVRLACRGHRQLRKWRKWAGRWRVSTGGHSRQVTMFMYGMVSIRLCEWVAD